MTHLPLSIARNGKELKLTPLKNDGGETVELTFEDSDLERLRQFVHRANLLRPALDGCQITTLHLSATIGEEGQFSATLPDEAMIDSFLMKMRPFILKKESLYFNHISKVMSRHFPLSDFRERAKEIHTAFNIPDLGFTCDINRDVINSIEGLDTWLYGDQYHLNEENFTKWRSWATLLPNDFLISLVLGVLIHRAQAILWLAEQCQVVLTAYNSAAENKN